MKKVIGIVSVFIIALIAPFSISMAQPTGLEDGGSNSCLTSPTDNVGVCTQNVNGSYYCVRSFGTPNCIGD